MRVWSVSVWFRITAWHIQPCVKNIFRIFSFRRAVQLQWSKDEMVQKSPQFRILGMCTLYFMWDKNYESFIISDLVIMYDLCQLILLWLSRVLFLCSFCCCFLFYVTADNTWDEHLCEPMERTIQICLHRDPTRVESELSVISAFPLWANFLIEAQLDSPPLW